MHKYTLNTPLVLGKNTITHFELQPLNAGTAINAAEAAEQVRFAPGGEPVVVASPVLATAERTRRQVRKLHCEDGSTLEGPMQLSDLRKLGESDYRDLIEAVEALDAIYLEREADARGQSDSTDASGNSDSVGAE